MRLDYYGHSCFALTTRGGIRLVIDPYHPSVGYQEPLRPADYTLVSHDHFDHNHVGAVTGPTTVVRGAAPRKLGLVECRGLVLDHDREEGRRLGKVVAFRLEAEGLTVAHLSDLGRGLTDEEVSWLGSVDVLLVPCGGGDYTLDGAAAVEVIQAVQPRLAIPMHYATPFIDRSRLEIEGVEKFLEKAGRVTRLRSSELDLDQLDQHPEIIQLSHFF